MKILGYCRQFVACLWLALMCVTVLVAAIMFSFILVVIPIQYATNWAYETLRE